MHVMHVQKIVTKCALSQNAQNFCYEMRVVTKCAEILIQNARCYKMCRNIVTMRARSYMMRSCYKMRLNRPSATTIHSFTSNTFMYIKIST